MNVSALTCLPRELRDIIAVEQQRIDEELDRVFSPQELTWLLEEHGCAVLYSRSMECVIERYVPDDVVTKITRSAYSNQSSDYAYDTLESDAPRNVVRETEDVAQVLSSCSAIVEDVNVCLSRYTQGYLDHARNVLLSVRSIFLLLKRRAQCMHLGDPTAAARLRALLYLNSSRYTSGVLGSLLRGDAEY